jgi:hypothetical protein
MKHLKKIFESGALAENSVVSILETTAADGKKYATNPYNLDAVIFSASFPLFPLPWRPVLARRGACAQGNTDASSMPHRPARKD